MGRSNNSRGRDSNENANTNALVLHEAKLPMPIEASRDFQVNAHQWKALTEAVWPAAETVDGVMLALQYCRARGLDPFKRPVHVVPMYNSKLKRNVETVWPGIGELRTTASRTGVWAGTDDCEFGPVRKKAFRDSRRGVGSDGEPYITQLSCPEFAFPEWAQVTVYRIVAGQRVPFVGPKVRFEEAFSGLKGLRVPNDRWRSSPFQMLEKCAEAAALRRAFPEEIGNEYTADEMEGQIVRDMPGAEAKYHHVSAEEADASGDDADDDQVEATVIDAEQPGADTADSLNGWNERELESFMDSMEKRLKKVDAAQLEQDLNRQSDNIASLPEREARLAKEWIDAARKRVGASDAGQDDRPEQADAADDTAEQEQGAAAGETAAQDDEDIPFIRNFRKRVDEVELVADLDTLMKNETRAIDREPGWVGKVCHRIVESRREALTKPR